MSSLVIEVSWNVLSTDQFHSRMVIIGLLASIFKRVSILIKSLIWGVTPDGPTKLQTTLYELVRQQIHALEVGNKCELQTLCLQTYLYVLLLLDALRLELWLRDQDDIEILVIWNHLGALLIRYRSFRDHRTFPGYKYFLESNETTVSLQFGVYSQSILPKLTEVVSHSFRNSNKLCTLPSSVATRTMDNISLNMNSSSGSGGAQNFVGIATANYFLIYNGDWSVCNIFRFISLE